VKDKIANSNPRIIQLQYERFICDFTINNETTDGLDIDIYREQLIRTRDRLIVNLHDLITFDPERGHKIQENPWIELTLFEKAAASILDSLKDVYDQNNYRKHGVQIILQRSINENSSITLIRNLTSDLIARLVTVKGIITVAAKPRNKATEIWIQCKNCHSTLCLNCSNGFGAVNVPRNCRAHETSVIDNKNKCPIDPFIFLPEKSHHIDIQILKLVEETVDTKDGDLPRSIMLLVDRYLVNKVIPGARITVYGIYSICTSNSGVINNKKGVGVRQPYIQVVGIQEENKLTIKTRFNDDEVRNFQDFAKKPLARERLINMIAPQIFGHNYIKKAIACLLFGGSRKKLPDGGTLRGDINVLLLGDPSTAKSQFLKFVEKTAHIVVYTSGKGSSAAGLTASVIRDPNSRDFYLEGGAMALADGGVVCIDEFDKMRPQDRVAIHEAMEQQTISIAKAGIATVLNARVAVLAAANPPSGRYDELLSPEENIDLQNTILSRFDLIFLIRDERIEHQDMKMAQHICSVHRDVYANLLAKYQEKKAEKDEFLKKYIIYSRLHCEPRFTMRAEVILIDQYLYYRSLCRNQLSDNCSENIEQNKESKHCNSLLITVRQLEALLRISEAIARMTLSHEVTEVHVEQAIQVYNVSMTQAKSTGIVGEFFENELQKTQVIKAVSHIRERISINQVKSCENLQLEITNSCFVDTSVFNKALLILIKMGEIVYVKERRSNKR
jgi:DNA replication licensing factor MCM5